MKTETKNINKVLQELAPLLSFSEQERLKYIEELEKTQLTKLSESINELIGYCDKIQRKEATLTNWLRERLKKEGWQVIHFAPEKQRGPDLKVVKEKGKEKKTIVIQVKGEPISAKNPPAVMHKNLNDALGDIINNIVAESDDVRYCIALSNKYLRLVKSRVPDLVRKKLGLYILFAGDESLKTLYPTEKFEVDLGSFDELFES